MQRSNPLTFRHASFHGRIGIARTDITPPVGIYARNWGAAKHDVASSIHRPLTLTTMTLAPLLGGPMLVFVDTDLGWWKAPATYRSFQACLLEALSLEPANLIIALSHTHSGPPLMDADDSLAGSDLHRSWMKSLFEATVRAVRQAMDSQSIATLDWQAGRCDLATSRDLPLTDGGKQRIVCGYSPNGATDDTLLAGRVTDSDGRIRATLANYACHPTTLGFDNTAVSPDYIGAMRETIQQATGAPALFLLGACGELAPRYQYVGDPNIADRHGKQLGFAVLATLYGMEPPRTRLVFDRVIESGAALAVWKREPHLPSQVLRSMQTTVSVPVKNWPSAAELEGQRLACTDRVLEERLRRKRNVRQSIGDRSAFNLAIHVWRIGDAVLVGTCCEAYSVAQKELRRQFLDNTILFMNLINGSLAYLPPAELYDTDVYPVWQTPFDRGCLEKTVAAMSQAIRDVLAN